jgi:uncharacterized OsmC-like protein
MLENILRNLTMQFVTGGHMAKHNKIDWKYETIWVDMTEEEADEIAKLVAEMIFEHMMKKDQNHKESAEALPSPIKQDR